MDSLAEFIRKHPWWRWLTRTPFSAKMTKYALSSGIAFMLGNLTFAFCYWLSLGTTIPSVLAFFAAAIPNWLMNRRWAWQQKGRAPMKQMISYAAVSGMVLLITAWVTGRTNHWVKGHVADHTGLRLLIVTGVFVVLNIVLFFAKFAIYEFVIFRHDDSRSRGRTAGPQSFEAQDDSKAQDGSKAGDGSEPDDDSEPPTTWNGAASALPSAHGRT
jgi:putative flippase GtrA